MRRRGAQIGTHGPVGGRSRRCAVLAHRREGVAKLSSLTSRPGPRVSCRLRTGAIQEDKGMRHLVDPASPQDSPQRAAAEDLVEMSSLSELSFIGPGRCRPWDRRKYRASGIDQ